MTRRKIARPVSHGRRSLGEMISSAVFLGMGGWLFLEGLSLSESAAPWRVWGLYICAVFCALAAFRFVIGALWERLMKDGSR